MRVVGRACDIVGEVWGVGELGRGGMLGIRCHRWYWWQWGCVLIVEDAVVPHVVHWCNGRGDMQHTVSMLLP